MAKRGASTDLNQDNWNNDDEPEKMGVFRKAPSNELKMRSIKRAKRRGVAGTEEGTSIFKNFTAFGATKTESTTPSFSFLSEDNKTKLTSSTTFVPFSFGSSISNDSSKKDSITSEDLKKESSFEKITDNTFTFNSDKPQFSFTSTSSNNKESTDGLAKSPAFKFGINQQDLSVKAKVVPSINLNFPSGSTSSTKQSLGETTFKFGVNSDENIPVSSSSSKPFFQTEKQSTSKPDIGSKSSTSESELLKESPKSSKLNGMGSSAEPNKGKNKLFLANLKALNIGVLRWIKQHVDKNQYINLIPIFNDYKDHFEELKKKFDGSTTKTEISSPKVTIGETSRVKESDPLTKNKTAELPKIKTPISGSSPAKNLNKADSALPIYGQVVSPSSSNAKTPEVKPFTFGISGSKSSEDKEASDSTPKSSVGLFSFGVKETSTTSFSFGSNSKPTFSFGSNNSSTSTTGFSFGSSKDNKIPSFGFGNTSNSSDTFSFKTNSDTSSTPAPESETTEATKENDDENEVPKVEVSEVKESDAIYEKKVKLFYKKADSYVDRGIGNLFLKPAGEKTQLLIRAHTNLGNILLNIILNESIPTQKVGKNNVLIVCVANPPIDSNSASTPVSMLIRVKTESDCDELLSKIDEHKN